MIKERGFVPLFSLNNKFEVKMIKHKIFTKNMNDRPCFL